jgi:hypothetical protein
MDRLLIHIKSILYWDANVTFVLHTLLLQQSYANRHVCIFMVFCVRQISVSGSRNRIMTVQHQSFACRGCNVTISRTTVGKSRGSWEMGTNQSLTFRFLHYMRKVCNTFKNKLDIRCDNCRKTHRNANLETRKMISYITPSLPPTNVISCCIDLLRILWIHEAKYIGLRNWIRMV